MTIKIQCPHCEQRISASDDVVGKDVECPTCQRVFKAAAIITPDPATAPVEPAGRDPIAPEQKPAAAPARAPLPIVPRPPARSGRGGTAIMVGSAAAVVAGGLFWWTTYGPGFGDKPAKSPAADGKKTPAQSQQASPPATTAQPPVADGSDPKQYQGVWRGTMPRTVVIKPYDVTVVITYNDRGEGFTKFETPDGDTTDFKAAGLATIFQSEGKDKVVLLREWNVSLSPDQKTMIWTEVNGPAQVKFTKE